MSIEDAIQQREFRSEHHKALLNILFTHNYLIGKINDLLKTYGVTRQQFNVLRIIRGQQPNAAGINLIKERMIDKMSDASRIVERLRIKDLVSRTASEADKRAAQIRLTTKGEELLKEMDSPVTDFGNELLALSEEEAKVLNSLLDKIHSN